jgi:ATP-dependent Clp protease ATP-binding subunit ClpA
MFERFTESARNVVTGAQDEARQLGAGFIGTEHLLLALLNPASGRPEEILREAGLDRDGVVAKVAQLCDQDSAVMGPADVEALRTIGIDLDAVVAAVEHTFGPGALRLPPVESPGRSRWRRWLRPSFLRRRLLRRRMRRREARLAASPAGRAAGLRPGGGHVPFTPKSKKVLELSLREALRLKHNHIGTEHILLGLLRQGDGLAAQVLAQSGLTLKDLRQRTLRAIDEAA